MSGYRALAGYGTLLRTNGEAVWDLPEHQVSGGTYVKYSPTEIFDLINYIPDGGDAGDDSVISEVKWQRFGAGCDFSVTIERNINFHNDIGLRTYTVATTGMLEPDFTINGYVSAEYLDWLKYALNVKDADVDIDTTTVGANTQYTYTYHYKAPTGPRMFDIGYVQMNSETNEYAGKNEFHILTGCAIDSLKVSYELGSDAGVQFTIEGKALMDWMSLNATAVDVNTYFEDVPSDVFSTGCVSTSTDGSSWAEVAQTDSAELTINNFLERRGQCMANWGSGYSMGTLNFEMNSNTYSNDPKKYELEMYGYAASSEDTSKIYNPQKVPYQIPYVCIRTNNATSPGSNDATKKLQFKTSDVIVSKLDKTYASESAIMDSPSMRGKDMWITVVYTVPTPSNSQSGTEEIDSP